MFSKAALFTTATLAVFVAALPTGDQTTTSMCNTGPVQCCNSAADTNDYKTQQLTNLLGISLDGVTGQAGFNCSPISAAALAGGSSCKSNAMCCSNNNFNGVISLGCSPIDLGGLPLPL